MAGKLEGKKIAFLAPDGVEQVELEEPWEAVRSDGAETELISLKEGEIRTNQHLDPGDKFKVDRAVADADAADYDGLVLPGGVANPDFMPMDESPVAFVRGFFEA